MNTQPNAEYVSAQILALYYKWPTNLNSVGDSFEDTMLLILFVFFFFINFRLKVHVHLPTCGPDIIFR